jgi:hypothetical protein
MGLTSSDRRLLMKVHHHIRGRRELHVSKRSCCLVLSLVIAFLHPLLNELSLALRPSLLPSSRTPAQLVFEFKLSSYQVLVGAMHGTGGSVIADVQLLILGIVLVL